MQTFLHEAVLHKALSGVEHFTRLQPDKGSKFCMSTQESAASGTAADSEPPLVHTHHFEQALQRVGPSVSKKDQRVYDALRWQLRSSRGHLNPQVNFPTFALLCDQPCAW